MKISFNKEKRGLALFLALLILLTAIPFQAFVKAQTTDITVTVVDQENAPVVGAIVDYTITAKEDIINPEDPEGLEILYELGAEVDAGSVTTDNDGTATLTTPDKFFPNLLDFNYIVTGENVVQVQDSVLLLPSNTISVIVEVPVDPNAIEITGVDQELINGEAPAFALSRDLKTLETIAFTIYEEDGDVYNSLILQKNIPVIKTPGTYTIDVKIYDISGLVESATVTTVIREGTINENEFSWVLLPGMDAYSVTKGTNASFPYDGQDHAAIEVEVPDWARVYYRLHNDDGALGEEQRNVPYVRDVGTYTFDLIITRYGYADFVRTVTITVNEGILASELTALTVRSSYDGNEKELFRLSGDNFRRGDDIFYTIRRTDPNGVVSVFATNQGGEPLGVNDSFPRASEVGFYEIDLEVKRNNYVTKAVSFVEPVYSDNQTRVKVENDEVMVALGNEYAIIAPTSVNLQFIDDENNEDNRFINFDSTAGSERNGYDFSAEIIHTNLTQNHNPQIKYRFTALELSSAPINELIQPRDGLATKEQLEAGIDTADMVILQPGAFTVTAYTVEEDGSIYYPASKSVNIYASLSEVEANFIEFRRPVVEYTLSTQTTASTQRVSLINPNMSGMTDPRYLSYSFELPGTGEKTNYYAGLEIDEVTGVVSVVDYDDLGHAMFQQFLDDPANFTGFDVTVYAHREEFSFDVGGRRQVFALEEEERYTLKINYGPIPSEIKASGAYVVSPQSTNGWYTKNETITVSLVAEPEVPLTYEIGHIGANPNDDADFTHQLVYTEPTPLAYAHTLKDGIVSAPVPITEVKIDSEAPTNLDMSYSVDLFHGVDFTEFTAPITLFYNATILNDDLGEAAVITFYADDVTSGVKEFNYTFTPGEDAKASDNPVRTGTVPAERIGDTDSYQGKLSLPLAEIANLQYNGTFSFTAKDVAGSVSEVFNDLGREITVIVDSLNPVAKINYYGYGMNPDYDGAAADPDILYSRDWVVAEVEMKEANFYPEDVVIRATKDGEEIELQDIVWDDNPYDSRESLKGDDKHFGDLTVRPNGEYTIDVSYTDRSRNEKVSLSTKTIIVDDTAPSYTMVQNQDYSTTFTFVEENFVPEDIVVNVSATRLDGSAVENPTDVQDILQNGEWQTTDGITHTLTIRDYVDGNYVISVSYTDPAGNPAPQEEDITFTQDNTPPSEVEISYSQPITESPYNGLLYRFYDNAPGVTITFRASDEISGVTNYEWRYIQEPTASGVNRGSFFQPTLNIEESNGIYATSSILLPADFTGEYRGHIEVRAVDNFGNKLPAFTIEDINRFVVDTIAPVGSFTDAQSVREHNATSYYDDTYTAEYTVNEANFFPADPRFTVSRADGVRQVQSANWTSNGDIHTASFASNGDGIYQLYLDYTDRSGNVMDSLDSGRIIVDTVDPVINVSYNNNAVQSTLNGRDYYGSSRTATVTITERNFNAADVDLRITATDVSGQPLNVANYVSQSGWSSSGDVHTMTINYFGDANYTFDIDYTDLAENPAADYAMDNFAVDATNPTDLTVSYSGSLMSTISNYSYYNSMITVTISATDSTAGIESFEYSYINAANVSSVNGQLLNQLLSSANITYSNGGRTATATFMIPRSALGVGNQFNGNVEFFARDRSQNTSQLRDGQRLIVDNISPTSNISYNEAYTIDDDVHYYANDIVATIEINEANFDANDVVVNVTKDGVRSTVTANWSSTSTDHHVGTLTLSGDGSYVIEVSYRDKSGNTMQSYQSNTMLIDTTIEAPKILFNGQDGNGKAFQGDVVPSIELVDLNFDTYEITLTRDRYGVRGEDVTDKFLSGGLQLNEEGAFASFDTFEKVRENDGIYTLTVTIVDKAGNTATETVTFSINRFGSVYKYGSYLSDLIANGGRTVKAVDEDIELLEVNPDKIKSGSVKVTITRDGKPLEDVIYDFVVVENTVAGIGESGWYEYRYVISKDNFKEDGVYKITISSVDEAGNTPENATQNQEIIFTVDNTPPEITSITGLEEPIIDASEQVVNYTVFDALGLKSIKVYVNGELLEEITDFEDPNNYSGSFTLYEKADIQNIRIVVEDQAGNITDTADDGFASAYSFNSNVTLSTNLFVRLQANPTLLWGSVAAITAALLLIAFFILLKRRKKEENPSEAA